MRSVAKSSHSHSDHRSSQVSSLLLLLVKHDLRLAREVAQVLLVRHQLVQSDHLLVEQHACDLAHIEVAIGCLDAGVNQVADELLLLRDVLQHDRGACTLLVRQTH